MIYYPNTLTDRFNLVNRILIHKEIKKGVQVVQEVYHLWRLKSRANRGKTNDIRKQHCCRSENLTRIHGIFTFSIFNKV